MTGRKSNHNEGQGIVLHSHALTPDIKVGQVVNYQGGTREERPQIIGKTHKRNQLVKLKAEVARSLAETMMGNSIVC
jgi:hypothetical protein